MVRVMLTETTKKTYKVLDDENLCNKNSKYAEHNNKNQNN